MSRIEQDEALQNEVAQLRATLKLVKNELQTLANKMGEMSDGRIHAELTAIIDERL